MKITVRMDDITPDMDWEKFYRFKTILDKYDIKPLIGVVPDNKDEKLKKNMPREDFWEYIRNLQQNGWIIAMHGFNHVYTTREPGLFPIGDKSEFAGIPYQKQDDMIREGKRILRGHGIVTDFFMAPSHSYDRNTLKALRKNGFQRVTDGFGIAPYEMDGLTFYPISKRRKDSLESKHEGIVTFVYHTNTMSDKDFENFEKQIEKAEFVSFDEFLSCDVTVRGTRGEIAEYLTAKGKFLAVRLKRNLGI
ncbi:MAG: DUF2334 domain-containing protein [Butyrivibrio sp.]|nr:DUF2334 domain-containing protein [Butyrivibrio sp.]